MRFIRHPFFERDLIGIVDHIVDVTDVDVAAASRRLDEIDALFQKIAENPKSGAHLSGNLDRWLMRHGGKGHRLTIVFKPVLDTQIVYLALVAFGGRDWVRLASARQVFADQFQSQQLQNILGRDLRCARHEQERCGRSEVSLRLRE